MLVRVWFNIDIQFCATNQDETSYQSQNLHWQEKVFCAIKKFPLSKLLLLKGCQENSIQCKQNTNWKSLTVGLIYLDGFQGKIIVHNTVYGYISLLHLTHFAWSN